MKSRFRKGVFPVADVRKLLGGSVEIFTGRGESFGSALEEEETCFSAPFSAED